MSTVKTLAFLALATCLAAPAAVRADTVVNLESNHELGHYATFDGSAFDLADGDFYTNDFNPGDPFVDDASRYAYDLHLTLDPATVTSVPGLPIIDGTFRGTYDIRFDGTSVSSGTVTSHGNFMDFGGVFFFGPTFDQGVFTQTAGAGLPDLPGVTTLYFAGTFGVDGPFFTGTLSDTAPAAAVPLPASATMGLGLIGLLGAAQVVRRRFRTV